jgi:putative superfamily III holin-X
MTRPTTAVQEPTVTDAIDRAVDAAQGLVGDEIALARLNVESALTGTVVGAILVVVGACLGMGAWTALLVAAYQYSTAWMPSIESLAAIAGVNAVLALALVLVGRRRLRAPAALPAVGDRR